MKIQNNNHTKLLCYCILYINLSVYNLQMTDRTLTCNIWDVTSQLLWVKTEIWINQLTVQTGLFFIVLPVYIGFTVPARYWMGSVGCYIKCRTVIELNEAINRFGMRCTNLHQIYPTRKYAEAMRSTDHESQSVNHPTKTVLESFIIFCVYRPDHNMILFHLKIPVQVLKSKGQVKDFFI